MARERWLIDEEELDEFQAHVRNLRLDGNYVVSGNAGSGKTVLALWRAKQIQNLKGGSDFTVLIYTKALRKFIESGIREIGLDEANVIHYDQWDRRHVDYIIVDEAQDFIESEIRLLISRAREGIMLFGDTAQQLYAQKKNENTLTIEQIVQITGFKVKPLTLNHRLPLTVARFAQSLNEQGDDLVRTCQKRRGPKPRIIRFETWWKELDFIMDQINSRGFKDVGILVPFNTRKTTGRAPAHYSVENVKEYFDSKSFLNLYKIKDDVDLDFDSDLPKIMTYHSSKGLQFDTVFIPHCGENWSEYRIPLYVALTRTSRNLIITYSDGLTRFFNGISSDLYETK